MAGDLRQELLAIRAETGKLTPGAVVTAAESPDHPLHHRFEWDDDVAGHKFRLLQAAELIRSVRIAYIQPTGQRTSIREFHVAPLPQVEREYEPIDEIMADPVKRQVLLNTMLREWKSFKARYQHMQEFMDLVAAEANGDAA